MHTTTAERLPAALASGATAAAPDRTEIAPVGSYVDGNGFRAASRVGSYVSGAQTGVSAAGGYTDRGSVRAPARRGSCTDAQR